jgi:hypothetical protein
MAIKKQISYFNTFIVKGDVDSPSRNWHVEESRIKGDFNADTVDLGVQAHIADKNYRTLNRKNAMIYSGIYNARTGVNNTNQFSIAKEITKAVDINYGGIQKLFSEDTNLVIFQEEKVHRALIDKDSIYTAEGGSLTIEGAKVISSITPYAGNFGIGKHPESFAYYAGRKYFVDNVNGAVMRLSRDGMTEISNYGMRKFFREELRNTDRVVGAWDGHNKDYVVSIQHNGEYKTVSFDEGAQGWTSTYSYKPEGGGSIESKFYTFNDNKLYVHYENNAHSYFYGVQGDATITFLFNINPSSTKRFATLNYEGSDNWSAESIVSDQDSANNILSYSLANQDLIIPGFKKKDNKYFSELFNNSTVEEAEVLFGQEISGVKGNWLKITLKNDSSDYKELFAASSNFNITTI